MTDLIFNKIKDIKEIEKFTNKSDYYKIYCKLIAEKFELKDYNEVKFYPFHKTTGNEILKCYSRNMLIYEKMYYSDMTFMDTKYKYNYEDFYCFLNRNDELCFASLKKYMNPIYKITKFKLLDKIYDDNFYYNDGVFIYNTKLI